LTGFVGVWWHLMRGNDVQKGGKCWWAFWKRTMNSASGDTKTRNLGVVGGL
jgi:hypothetical protein